jgi:hypothetical protein
LNGNNVKLDLVSIESWVTNAQHI